MRLIYLNQGRNHTLLSSFPFFPFPSVFSFFYWKKLLDVTDDTTIITSWRRVFIRESVSVRAPVWNVSFVKKNDVAILSTETPQRRRESKASRGKKNEKYYLLAIQLLGLEVLQSLPAGTISVPFWAWETHLHNLTKINHTAVVSGDDKNSVLTYRLRNKCWYAVGHYRYKLLYILFCILLYICVSVCTLYTSK